MASATDFRVHLIFSEGQGIVKIEERYQVYGIALFPFVLGVPPDRVDFTVNPTLIQEPDLLEESANEAAFHRQNDSKWFPSGYHDYFKAVCLRASGVDRIWEVDRCSIRIVTGHGLPRPKSGRLVCEGKDVLFQEFGQGQASILTLLDVSNAPFAVAALAGHYRNEDPSTAQLEPRKRWTRRLNQRFEFVDNCTNATFACDNMDFTYAFRVSEDLGVVPRDGSTLSKPFGDAVIHSVLVAARDLLMEGSEKQSLDNLFKTRFKRIKTDHIGGEERNPTSQLGALEELLRNGSLTINPEAFKCKLFRNSHLWYFTTEPMPSGVVDPTIAEPALVSAAIRFVVGCLCLWHTANPDHTEKELPQSRHAWSVLVVLLGKRLRSVLLDANEETGEVEPCEDGTSIEVWACTCKDLPRVLQQVENMLASRSLLDDERSESD